MNKGKGALIFFKQCTAPTIMDFFQTIRVASEYDFKELFLPSVMDHYLRFTKNAEKHFFFTYHLSGFTDLPLFLTQNNILHF